jgi:hypothetical protein
MSSLIQQSQHLNLSAKNSTMLQELVFLLYTFSYWKSSSRHLFQFREIKQVSFTQTY